MSPRLQKSAKTTELAEKPGPHRGVLDLAHAGQNFTLRRYFPSATLAPFIEHFWTIHWDLRGRPNYTAEVLPHPAVNIAFTRDRGWITGVTTAKYTYDLEGAGEVLGIQFRPGAFRGFLGGSVATITDKTLPATDVLPAAGDAFRGHLLDLPTDGEIIAEAETLLGANLPAIDPNVELINEIIALVRDDRELTSVASLARRFARPERTLQHLFATYVGVGLKWIIRRYRIMEAAERVEAGDESWTSLAHELGYSDQAHFTNDFTKLVGRAPSDHARRVARD
jgi:AraC-like DNA-binding protein